MFLTDVGLIIYTDHYINKGTYKNSKIHFSGFFFLKCKRCIIWKWFVAKMIFEGYSKSNNG